eukprot:g2743.t1
MTSTSEVLVGKDESSQELIPTWIVSALSVCLISVGMAVGLRKSSMKYCEDIQWNDTCAFACKDLTSSKCLSAPPDCVACLLGAQNSHYKLLQIPEHHEGTCQQCTSKDCEGLYITVPSGKVMYDPTLCEMAVRSSGPGGPGAALYWTYLSDNISCRFVENVKTTLYVDLQKNPWFEMKGQYMTRIEPNGCWDNRTSSYEMVPDLEGGGLSVKMFDKGYGQSIELKRKPWQRCFWGAGFDGSFAVYVPVVNFKETSVDLCSPAPTCPCGNTGKKIPQVSDDDICDACTEEDCAASYDFDWWDHEIDYDAHACELARAIGPDVALWNFQDPAAPCRYVEIMSSKPLDLANGTAKNWKGKALTKVKPDGCWKYASEYDIIPSKLGREMTLIDKQNEEEIFLYRRPWQKCYWGVAFARTYSVYLPAESFPNNDFCAPAPICLCLEATQDELFCLVSTEAAANLYILSKGVYSVSKTYKVTSYLCCWQLDFLSGEDKAEHI